MDGWVRTEMIHVVMSEIPFFLWKHVALNKCVG
jgi:hypothetical protein